MAVAAVTRVQGLALVAVPVVACWVESGPPPRTRLIKAATSLALFAAPVVAYLIYLAEVQGSAQAFVERQAMWSEIAHLLGRGADQPAELWSLMHRLEIRNGSSRRA